MASDDREIDDAGLLQGSAAQYLGLDGQLHFDATGVRFRPDEAGVDQPDGAVAAAGRGRPFTDALDAAEAESEELFGFRGGAGPVFRRLEVALAGGAPEDGELRFVFWFLGWKAERAGNEREGRRGGRG